MSDQTNYRLLVELDSNYLKLKDAIQNGDTDPKEQLRDLELSIMKLSGILGFYHSDIRYENEKQRDGE